VRVYAPFLVAPFHFHFPRTHALVIDACLNVPLTEIVLDFDMTAALLDSNRSLQLNI